VNDHPAAAAGLTSGDPDRIEARFPIAGIGASAGGLEAIVEILRHVTRSPGLAIVVVQHLAPGQPTQLPGILADVSPLPVVVASDGVRLRPDHVYVMPENVDLTIGQGILHLSPRTAAPGRHRPIDAFFGSLAADQGELAVGVVLSGADSDGTIGLQEIRGEGGITIAQDPATAKYTVMPTSAIIHGGADLTLSPAAIAETLCRLPQHPLLKRPATPAAGEAGLAQLDLPPILQRLQAHYGVDFSQYKQSTLRRRVARRMALFGADTLEAYLAHLDSHAGEAQALFDDLLINVTSFFRDPPVFEALQQQVFPALIEHRTAGRPIRLWVAGCASGEEAYSLAICLLETLGEAAGTTPIQVFATDISEQAIATARQGFYPDEAVTQVSPQRLQRFFTRVPGGYRIHKAVRDLCLFVRHDLTSDPPFSKLDLISCRNVLIYFGRILQQRVAPIFHYALNPGGFLVIGRSEGLSEFSQLFSVVDKSNKIFLRKQVRTPPRLEFGGGHKTGVAARHAQATAVVPAATNIQQLADALLLERYVPAGVLISDTMDILQFRGRMGPYLEPSQGVADLNLFKMVKSTLLAELRLAIHHARKTHEPVRREHVPLGPGEALQTISIEVLPLQAAPPGLDQHFLVLFAAEPPVREGGDRPAASVDATADTLELTRELAATREMLTSVIEQYETANEELVTANEESVSANEELQSINEEMETAKEELQSANEELTTVNDELHSRNTELNQLNSDLSNLLSSIDIAIVMLDRDRRIRRFTPKAVSSFNLIPGDVGRPIGDIRPSFVTAGLEALVDAVTTAAAVRVEEVQDRHGHWFSLHIRPYLTPEGTVSGTVLALFDIDTLKRTAAEAEAARDYAAAIIETVPVALLTLDGQLRVCSANRTFYETFAVSPAETVGLVLYELGNRQWDIPSLRSLLEEVLPKHAQVSGYEVRHTFPTIGTRTMLVSARQVKGSVGTVPTIVMAIQDITERAWLLASAQAARVEAEQANRAKDVFLATLSHELRTPLTTILGWLPLLQAGRLSPEKAEQALQAVQNGARAQARLIEDLLDVSRISAGKIHLQLEPTDVAAVVQSATAIVRPNAEQAGVQLDVAADAGLPPASADPARLQQVVWNLLSNAVKFTPAGGRVTVRVSQVADHIRILVHDTGMGIDAAFLPHVFEQFQQMDTPLVRRQKGLGLGLWLVWRLVELHHGRVTADSPGKGLGATFTVELPVSQQAPPPPAVSRSPGDLDGLHVLLVEDDLPGQEMLAEILSQYGAVVRTAGSVDAALARFDERVPDVLISDISMPGKSGIELIRAVRQRPAGQGGDTPAIAITAHGIDVLQEPLREAGFQAGTGKPVIVDQLIALIHRYSRRA
jgi:two-component system CheB/CheR fusion protein